MARRPTLILLAALLTALAVSGSLYAQLESGERGILPIDSAGTLEITGIRVDAGGRDAQSARLAGWRMAQREGFRALWAKTHNRPVSEAPTPSDAMLDQMVSSIIVEREQIGPNRYIAQLGILFDRARAGELLGFSGEYRRSVPMLLVPVMISGGTAVSVEVRNPWQRAWAQFRTAQSPIDYVRISGLGIDPLLVNAAQTKRPGRGWWRNLIDLYGAADILIAEVAVNRAYPGGPAVARFIARHGADGRIIGGFSLTARDSASLPAMMDEGVRRMDALFAQAHAAGLLVRDPTLDIPEPPPPPVEIVEEAPAPRQTEPAAPSWEYQVQIVSPDVNVYNFAMAHLRTMAGVEQVSPVRIAPGGVSYVNITYRGDLNVLGSGLAARGWNVSRTGWVLRLESPAAQPPPVPTPSPAPAPPAQQQPSPPAAPPQQQPPPGQSQ